MRIEFWGTRGSIAKPGPTTIRYGGNTSCVELRASDGTRIVCDCGTGAHGLGQALLTSGEKPIRGHLLIGHTHWDHIQGLPFFTPLFIPGNEWDIYAPRGLRSALQETLAGQMQFTYFPVGLDQLGATIRYHDLTEGSYTIGSATVRAQYLNHTALTLGYRIEVDGVVIVYATDHEPHARPQALDPGQLRRPIEHKEDRRHADFFTGADLLIHDAQYTTQEYPSKIGWGHSTFDYVVEMALMAGVRRLALFHHDPLRSDDALDRIVGDIRAIVARAGETMDVFAAAEGQVIDLVPSVEPRPLPPPRSTHRFEWDKLEAEESVALVTSEPALIETFTTALQAEPFHLAVIPEGQGAEQRLTALRPAIVVLSRRGPAWDGLELTRRLREHQDSALRSVPIVLVAAAEDAADVALGFEAGATDWLTQPCSPAFVQSRLRAWLLRSRARWTKPPEPHNEARRLEAVRAMNIIGTPREARFDRLTRMAAFMMRASYAFLSFVEVDRLWFKSTLGVEIEECPRDIALCSYVVLSDSPLVVPDARIDELYGDNPAFHDARQLRFYVGVPIHSPGGEPIGSLCVYDAQPRQLRPEDIAALTDMATLIERELVRDE